ncbi:MAG: LacI family DNA-binding transcriptional regulator [Hespellia sp.]|nr:LacI family DNA-binding transcriptional regulator [Hespellia sp.]
MSKERPTMKDVADKAGVTQPTVSYVINGTAKVTDEVKKNVMNAINELNYKPNYYARALKTNKTNIVGIIIPDISNQYYSSMVNIVEDALAKEHQRVIIGCTDYEKLTEESAIRHMMEYNLTGMIVMYQLASKKAWTLLEKANCRVVALETNQGHKNVICVNTDSFNGGYAATECLIKKGRKKIAYVGQESHIDALIQRRMAYERAMDDYHLSDNKMIYSTKSPGNKWKEGLQIGEQLLHEKIDGIVVSSDIVAAGILKVLIMNKINIPEDISVIGYDDIPLAELFIPSISTIRQPMAEMCSLAVASVMKKNDEHSMQLLKPELIERETT